jgi:hypothetical protein
MEHNVEMCEYFHCEAKIVFEQQKKQVLILAEAIFVNIGITIKKKPSEFA